MPPLRSDSTRAIRRPRGGFTLLEVLVALAIFALAAIVLGGAYLNILNSYEIVSRNAVTSEDVAYARQIVLAEPDRKKLEEGGEFDTASGGHVKWTVEIVSTSTADLFTVTFACALTTPGQADPQTKTETFTLLRPTWTNDPAEHDKLRLDAKTRILEMQGKKPS